nr:hypothetical protein [Tanacetum cinerariifolium]
MVAKKQRFPKKQRLPKVTIVISSNDDEVSSDDEVLSDDVVSSDEELTSHDVSNDDEVSSKEEVIIIASSKGPYTTLLKCYDDFNNEDFPEYYFAMPKASNSKVYTSSASKAFASKDSKASKALNASKASLQNLYGFNFKCLKDDNDVVDMNAMMDNLENRISNIE